MPKNKEHLNKTNAMRILDAAGLPYKIAEYEWDESDLSGNHAVSYLGITEDEMFKTLVTRNNNNLLYVFMVPVSGELDLKKAAAATGVKHLEMIHVKEIFPLTGYMRGGCSPIGMKKDHPLFIDETAVLFDEIYFSGGQRGISIIMDPNALISMRSATLADLVKE